MSDQLATAEDWAGMTFEPMGESRFDMTKEMGKAHEPAFIKCFGLEILKRDDVELTKMISESDDPNVLLDLHDSLGGLADYYEDGLECVKGAQARLMVAMTRWAVQEGIDTDGGAS